MKKLLRIFPDFITAFRWATSIKEFRWKFGEYYDNDFSGIRNFFYRFNPGQSKILHEIHLKRKKWKNWGYNIEVDANGYFFPESLKHIQLIVEDASKNGFKVKPIGSGHSFTDILTTNGYLVNTHRLNRVLKIDKSVVKSDFDLTHMVELECGITIRDINKYLYENKLGLYNMGGYDAQTIVGAMSTSTHGSGITLGSITSSVQSLILVSDNGKTYKIEPSNGMTDPILHAQKHPHIELKQDDDWFNSVCVSMGCMGIIYSVVVKVRERYFLSEVKEYKNWKDAKENLIKGDVLRDNRHYEVLIVPYKYKGEYYALETFRNDAVEFETMVYYKRKKKQFSDWLAKVPTMPMIMSGIMNFFPNKIPWILNFAIKGLKVDRYIDRSYKVLHVGGADYITAISMEIAFPMDKYLEAVDTILEITEKYASTGHIYLTSPISLRFIKASPHYLAMQYGEDTCMIEMPSIVGTIGAKEILYSIEQATAKYRARPHWGQMNNVTNYNQNMNKLYPKWNEWVSVYKQLNTKQTFSNQFTNRMGLDS